MSKLIVLLFLIQVYYLSSAQYFDYNPKEIEIDRFKHPNFQSFRDFVAANLIYPPTAVEKGISGVLIAGLKLNTEGKIEKVFCLNSLHKDIDNFVLDLFVSSEQYWVPNTDTDSNHESVILIVPIVFTYQGSEYYIDSSNVRLKLLGEVIIKAVGVYIPSYIKTKNLKKHLIKHLDQNEFQKAYYTVSELLRREPFNTDYYSELIRLEIFFEDNVSACKNLKFVKTYFKNQPTLSLLENLNCE